MKQKDYVTLFFEVMDLLDEALHWLRRSYGICQKIGVKEEYEEDEYDKYETLTSRFARVSDIIIRKVFRSIDKIEFEEEGTLIDVLNRSHKRGLIKSIEEIREIRELRNEIVHEYTHVDKRDLFGDVLRFTKVLLDMVERVKSYGQRFKVPDEIAETQETSK